MTILAGPPPPLHSLLDDLPPESGLAPRRWTPAELRRMASAGVIGPGERLDSADGQVVGRGGLPRLFSRAEYYRLAEHDILQPGERTELIYGRVIRRMSPMGRPHSIAVTKTAAALVTAFGGDHSVETQMPVQLDGGAEPELDVLVLAGRSDDYPDVPAASDALLLLEVSDTTLRYDRGTKAWLYAANAVPDYWLINLGARTLEVRRRPESGTYQSADVYSETEAVAPLAVPDAPIRVADLLPLEQRPTEP